MVRRCDVNRWLWVGLVLVGCQAARSPVAPNAFAVGQVAAATTEPGLEDALRAGIASALTERSALAESGTAAVDIAVLTAVTQATSVSQAGQSFAARLQISVRVGDRARQFSSERNYTVIDAVQGEAARKAAFEALAEALARDAVVWLLASKKSSND